MEHTKTPWRAILDGDKRHHACPIMSEVGNIDDNGSGLVASAWGGKGAHFSFETAQANAAFIVEAVNNHERLKRQVEELRASLTEILDYNGGADNALEDDYVMERAVAALESTKE